MPLWAHLTNAKTDENSCEAARGGGGADSMGVSP